MVKQPLTRSVYEAEQAVNEAIKHLQEESTRRDESIQRLEKNIADMRKKLSHYL